MHVGPEVSNARSESPYGGTEVRISDPHQTVLHPPLPPSPCAGGWRRAGLRFAVPARPIVPLAAHVEPAHPRPRGLHRLDETLGATGDPAGRLPVGRVDAHVDESPIEKDVEGDLPAGYVPCDPEVQVRHVVADITVIEES